MERSWTSGMACAGKEGEGMLRVWWVAYEQKPDARGVRTFTLLQSTLLPPLREEASSLPSISRPLGACC